MMQWTSIRQVVTWITLFVVATLIMHYFRDDLFRVQVALVYLLLPSTQWLTLNEFHPVALAAPLLLWAFWFLDEERLLPFAVLAVPACLTKEEIPLVVGAMGVWYAVSRRQWPRVIAAAARRSSE